MKILSIGNSFSADAQRWLHDIAAADGVELTCVNLYIGGCYLERHYRNFKDDVCAYDWQENGQRAAFRISMDRALKKADWDVVTISQASSRQGGGVETWEPYFTELVAHIRELAPQAEIVLFEPWACEIDSPKKWFANIFDRDQKKMFRQICATYEKFSAQAGLRVLPVGEAIQYVRENVSAFDYANGGRSLNRDGFHLSMTYGRYIAALVWYAKLLGGDVTRNSFVPCDEAEPVDEGILGQVRAAVGDFLQA